MHPNKEEEEETGNLNGMKNGRLELKRIYAGEEEETGNLNGMKNTGDWSYKEFKREPDGNASLCCETDEHGTERKQRHCRDGRNRRRQSQIARERKKERKKAEEKP
jgi:hypothetical protein